MNKIDEKEIKQMIKNGFDISLISFEFDIPLEYVKKCEEDLISEKKHIENLSGKNDLREKKKMKKQEE